MFFKGSVIVNNSRYSEKPEGGGKYLLTATTKFVYAFTIC